MILHLSDLHFGTEREACMQAIRQLCEEHPFEAVVVSGEYGFGSWLKIPAATSWCTRLSGDETGTIRATG